MKLWSGMLSGELDKSAEKFNSSINVDKRLVFYDIKASIAHAKMLEETKIIKDFEAEKIISGLENLEDKLKKQKITINLESEDIHTFIEGELVKEIGDIGKKLHTARSRNDQVTTDLRLYLRDEIENIKKLLEEYIKVILKLANENLDTIMPGFTHLQKAQAVTFAHHIMAYAMMGLRDIERIKDYKKRLNSLPLGACALAGTTYNIDREFTKEILEFDSIMQNSMDAVSDRDYVMELQSIISIISIHLSRLSEEIVIWSSQAFRFVEIDDRFSTGSSIMPQKKNPDMAELIRSKSARIIGNMNQSFIMMKALGLSYSKDMQEDKESIFNSIDNIEISLKVMTGMLDTIKINKSMMLKSCEDGYLNATDVADYLVKKGVAFRNAHHISAHLVKKAMDMEVSLSDLKLEYYKEESDKFNEDIYDFINLKKTVESRKSLGGPAKAEVKRQISYVEDKLI